MRKITLVAALLLSIMAIGLSPIGYTGEPSINPATESENYIIVFAAWKLPANVETIIEECGGTVIGKCPNIGVVAAKPNITPADFEAMLSEVSGIQKFGHDYIVEIPHNIVADELGLAEQVDSIPADPYYWIFQWHMWHAIDASPWGAWSVTTGSPDVKVAICDTGIDMTHPDLDDNYDPTISKSFVPYEPDPGLDLDGHGTHCAGIVAAEMNDMGTIGVGPDLTIVSLKVLNYSGVGDFFWLIDAIYYAANNGIDVASMSLGAYVPFSSYPYGPGAVAGLYAALERAFAYATRNGVLCIASAGNTPVDADKIHPYVHLPSQCSNVLCVIASDIYDGLAHYSTYGSGLHGITAPGGDNDAYTMPDWYPYPDYWDYYNNLYPGYYLMGWTFSTLPGGYGWGYGTSSAVPHVSGVAGLILSVYPNLKPAQVEYLMKQSAVDIGDPGYDEYFNFGLLNAYNSVTMRMPQAKGRWGLEPN